MSDFIGGFWHYYIAAITLVSIAACAALLMAMSKRRVSTDPEKTSHVWDEDLDEYNNPLPRWWIWLFWITIFYSLGYLWFYPGLGSFEGAGKWTSAKEYAEEVQVAEKEFAPIYERFAGADLRQVAADPEARLIGQRLVLNYCTQCHASDARGGKGDPDLTDNDWLYGGDPEQIQKSILDGRNGTMPALGAALGPDAVRDLANYVRSLSGLDHDALRAVRGKEKFVMCAACHGPEGKGNVALGAPNLTDRIWLHGSSEATIIQTITKGRQSHMPAHRELLGEARVKLLTAYVYGLSLRQKNVVPVAATATK